jgi:hypothetical protein
MRTPIIPLEMTCWLGIVDQRDATLPDHGQRQESKAVLCYTNGEVETLISPGVGNAHREKRRSRALPIIPLLPKKSHVCPKSTRLAHSHNSRIFPMFIPSTFRPSSFLN